MNLKLNPATKESFLSIISTMGMDKVLTVFKQFLVTGKPIGIEEFSQLMGSSEPEAIILAQEKGELNNNGQLIGFLGFSLVPTSHQMIIEGNKFYTWCAADTLVFPAILDIKTAIVSVDPLTNSPIEVVVDRDSLLSISLKEAMISWIDEVDDSDIRCTMCNRVHFFESEASAKEWQANNSDARIFTVVDFFATGMSGAECC